MHSHDVVQVFGAVLVLVPFAALQLGRTTTESVPYLSLNVVGSGLLATVAIIEQQWGFLLLEAVWMVVAAGGLLSRAPASIQDT